jgi:hypothetical protein
MFEVALCVMAYSTVLIIEFLPAILVSLETSEWKRLLPLSFLARILRGSNRLPRRTLKSRAGHGRRPSGVGFVEPSRPATRKRLIFSLTDGMSGAIIGQEV